MVAWSREYSRPSLRGLNSWKPASRSLGVEEAELRGDLGPGRDDDEPVAAAAAHAHEEPAVLLVVDELVVGLGGAEGVPPDLVGAPGLVDGRVVELLARRVPGGAPDDADDLVGAVLAGGQVEDPDRVALVADHVGRVGEEGAVGADAGAAQREELVAVGQCVEVEQQLLARERGLVGRGVLGGPRRRPVVGAGHRDPAAGAVLLPLEGPAVVPVAAVAGRHGEVGLAGAGLDLVEDRLPQVGEVRGLCLRVLVLRLEVGHHLRRALGAQPFVVVDAGPSVVLGGDGAACGRRAVAPPVRWSAAHVGTYRRVPRRRSAAGSEFLHRQWLPHVEKPWNLWSYPVLLWSNLWDQKNVELSLENPLRTASGRA